MRLIYKSRSEAASSLAVHSLWALQKGPLFTVLGVKRAVFMDNCLQVVKRSMKEEVHNCCLKSAQRLCRVRRLNWRTLRGTQVRQKAFLLQYALALQLEAGRRRPEPLQEAVTCLSCLLPGTPGLRTTRSRPLLVKRRPNATVLQDSATVDTQMLRGDSTKSRYQLPASLTLLHVLSLL